MKKARVHRIFDTHGVFGDGGGGGYSRLYVECQPGRPSNQSCLAMVEYAVSKGGTARVSLKNWNQICGDD